MGFGSSDQSIKKVFYFQSLFLRISFLKKFRATPASIGNQPEEMRSSRCHPVKLRAGNFKIILNFLKDQHLIA
jgi:hypothetical protein